jgi:hypothetical protein
VTGFGPFARRCAQCVSAMTAIVALVAACGSENGGLPTVVSRDSAGVRIVELASFDEATLPVWTLEGEARLDIGTLDGDEAYQLFQVSSAVLLTDGRLVIGNGGTKELRFYDAKGRYLESVGREGEGPGEFGAVGSIGIAGDSLCAFDWRLVRASVFDLDGVFVRSYPVRVQGIASPNAIGVFRDGGWVLLSGFVFSPQDVAAVVRDTSLVVHLHSDGVVADTIGRFPTTEYFVWGDGTTTTAASRAFGRSLAYAVGDARVYLGDTERYEISGYSPGGMLEWILRRSGAPRKVTGADIQAYKEVDRRRLVDARFRQQMERLLAEMPYPGEMPAFGDLKTDVLGDVWVSEYKAPGADSLRWTVYDPEAKPVARVSLPAELQVTQIGVDFVLGLWRDEVDVEHVRLYGLVKE